MDLPQTSLSLLDGLALDRAEAWDRFVHYYGPVLHDWARRRRWLQAADEVFAALVVEMPSFRKDPNKRFRDWIGAILRNKCIDRYRRWAASQKLIGNGRTDEAEEPDWTEAFIDKEYASFVAARALQLLKVHFNEKDWRACWDQLIRGRSAKDVAVDLGITINKAFLAKSRGMKMLREELRGLIDGAVHAIIDFQAVQYLSSAGFRPLLSLNRHVREHGGRLVLCNMQPQVEEVFTVTRLIDPDGKGRAAFIAQPTVPAAVAHVCQAEAAG